MTRRPVRSLAAAAIAATLVAVGLISPALAQVDFGDEDDAPDLEGPADPDAGPDGDDQDQDPTDDGPAGGIEGPAPLPPAVFARTPADWPTPADPDVGAYVLLDAGTGQVLAASADADEPRPIASTVKILTVLSATARLDLDAEVTVGSEVAGVPGSGVGLVPGDTWTVRQLVDGLIARSGNEAAEAIAVAAAGTVGDFLQLMREDAERLGIDDPQLVSVSGLDDANVLSARDLAVIARVALSDETLRDFFAATEVTLPSEGTVPSRNELLTSYPGATGMKTGFTTAAGNSLVASAERGGRELIVVVLDAGDDPARFDVAADLLDHGFEAFRGAEVGARVVYAVAGGEVTVVVDPTAVVTPQDRPAQLRVPIAARAPESGAALEVEVEVDGVTLGSVPARIASSGSAPVEGEARIGRSLVDGIWGGLRTAAAADGLR
ncbi:MAG: D-alanyl-D-alanine carboxypeptidase [Nitriliruptoraceae bacterium]|nr:D-alanyl-D-alanine carboxypeptidase [Nitriliruptoraceae bacterium]